LRRSFGLEEEKAGSGCPDPAAATSPSKAPQDFPELDRQPEACKIYTMPKKRETVQRGRPAIPGRRVVVKLEESDIATARKLGGGGKQAIAAGVRKALRQAS
jgi:hypothetical protein